MSVRVYTYFPLPQHERRYLADFMKPFVKVIPISQEEREKIYGQWTSTVSFTSNPAEADFAVLPCSWNYYLEAKQEAEAYSFILRCRLHNLRVITQLRGDFGVIPLVEDCTLLRPNGYLSKNNGLQFGMPVFIPDPLKSDFSGHLLKINAWTEKPLVGFCGLAGGGFKKYTTEVLRILFRNCLFKMGLSVNEPQAVFSASKLRMDVLNVFQKSKLIQGEFIIRNKYRAGASNEIEKINTSKEYFENIRNTQYTVCVRGGGNFSARLYETLAMGRIPVFVNTDCFMPFPQLIDWKKHVVWVEENEIESIDDKVLEFHKQQSMESFIELQKANRSLWENFLSYNGFWNTFLNEIMLKS